MQIYDWFLLVLAAIGLAMGIAALNSARRGMVGREYGGMAMFLALGLAFVIGSLYVAWLAYNGMAM